MDTSVYEHLAEEQKQRYYQFRDLYPQVSELVCQQLFFSQIQEMNITKIINQGFFADSVLKTASFSA